MASSVSFETVREIALALPGVVGSMGRRGIAFKVRGKMLTCKAIHRSAEEGSLMVRLDSERRAKWLAAEPEVYYLTPHYEPYPCVLVRLSRISRNALADRLAEAWSFVTRDAPKSREAPKSRAGTPKKRAVRKRR